MLAQNQTCRPMDYNRRPGANPQRKLPNTKVSKRPGRKDSIFNLGCGGETSTCDRMKTDLYFSPWIKNISIRKCVSLHTCPKHEGQEAFDALRPSFWWLVIIMIWQSIAEAGSNVKYVNRPSCGTWSFEASRGKEVKTLLDTGGGTDFCKDSSSSGNNSKDWQTKGNVESYFTAKGRITSVRRTLQNGCGGLNKNGPIGS